MLGRGQAGNQGGNSSEPSSSANNLIASKAQPSGIWGLASELIRLSGKIHALKDEVASTEELQKSATELQAPLMDYLRTLIRQGDQLFAAADTADPAELALQKKQLDALTVQFRQTTAGMLPLSKINVLLGIYQTTLKNWRESVRDEERDESRQLLLRLSVLLVLIGLVLGVGEIWRRMTFRYIHDVRRRYQFLLLRRVVMWAASALILILAFATQLGSAVTFAGLITAGVAVALQSVIVSVVGYFFLIGKYGLRVGDRVQIEALWLLAGLIIAIGKLGAAPVAIGAGRGTPEPTFPGLGGGPAAATDRGSAVEAPGRRPEVQPV